MAIVLAYAPNIPSYPDCVEQYEIGAFRAALKRRGHGLILATHAEELLDAIQVIIPEGIVACGNESALNKLVEITRQEKKLSRYHIGFMPFHHKCALSKFLKIPKDVSYLAQAIASDATHTMDYAIACGKYPILSSLLINFNAQANGSQKKKITPNLYQRMPEAPSRITLQAQGIDYAGAYLLVHNIQAAPIGVKNHKHTNPYDGALNWILLPRMTATKRMQAALAIKNGMAHKIFGAISGNAETLTIRHQGPVEIDGRTCTIDNTGTIIIQTYARGLTLFDSYSQSL